jgi:hypothetical protein
MATDVQILRSLLACLSGDGGELDRFDPDRVVSVAHHHRLAALLGAIRPAGVPASLRERFRRDHLGEVARNMRFQRALVECLGRLADAGVEAIVLKGLVYDETIYRQPGSRPTNDVDLLVEPRLRAAAFGALQGAGYAPVAAAPGFDEADYHEVEWTRGGVEIDLHFSLAPLARYAIDYRAVWAGKRSLTIGGVPTFQLAAPHAAAYHALHIAGHHFDVPAIYLVDMSRLVPDDQARAAGEATARAWRCSRAWHTTMALTAAFVPGWPLAAGAAAAPGGAAARIVGSFGTTAPLPRAEQLRRKIESFDSAVHGVHYLLVQARRLLREEVLRRFSDRTPEERLGLSPRPRRP